MFGIANAGVMEIAHVPSNLMKSTRLGEHTQERAARIVAASYALDSTFRVAKDALGVLHGCIYRDRLIVFVVTPNERDVRLSALS